MERMIIVIVSCHCLSYLAMPFTLVIIIEDSPKNRFESLYCLCSIYRNGAFPAYNRQNSIRHIILTVQFIVICLSFIFHLIRSWFALDPIHSAEFRRILLSIFFFLGHHYITKCEELLDCLFCSVFLLTKEICYLFATKWPIFGFVLFHSFMWNCFMTPLNWYNKTVSGPMKWAWDHCNAMNSIQCSYID